MTGGPGGGGPGAAGGPGGAGVPPPPVPPGPPTAASLQDRTDFRALVDASVKDTRASAETWRTGLAALVTLVTTGLLIKGPEEAAKLPDEARALIVFLLVVGLGLAVLGLYHALAAAAGVPATVERDDVVARYGSVRGFQVAQAVRAADRLRDARHLVLLALPTLGLATVAWLLSTPSSGTPVVVVHTGETRHCGTLLSADDGEVRIDIPGESDPRVTALDDLTNLEVAAECP